jgi:hypothetical protein
MKNSGPRRMLRRLVLTVVAASALTVCSMAMAVDVRTPEDQSAPEQGRPGPVGLGVSGASAGITTDYFEQAVTDALGTSGIFSGIDNSRSAEVIMPMIRMKSVFPGTVTSDNTPYFLNIRIIKVDTPSFSIWMTVGMDVVWALYRSADKTELLHEKIYSTYTGGMFEGGVHGANRVRVAMEGATRENIKIGIGMLESLDLAQDFVSLDSGQE